ncbi:hypothetical protein KDK77_10330, partial [bacterium]|nr:hypothetical protein [bacterium]
MPTQCIIILTVLSVLFSPSFSVWAEDATRMVPLDEFIQTAAASDTVFEEILIDELRLRYRKALFIPARDLILSIKNQYDFILNQDRNEPETVIGLTKLFPHSGTSVSAEYSTFPTLSSGTNSSELSFSVSQSIARNAFGKGTQLLDK